MLRHERTANFVLGGEDLMLSLKNSGWQMSTHPTSPKTGGQYIYPVPESSPAAPHDIGLVFFCCIAPVLLFSGVMLR